MKYSKCIKSLWLILAISVVMCIVGIVLMMSVSSALSQRGETGTTFSTASKPFAGGDGTQDNPYLIATPEQFDNVRYFIYHRNEAGEFDTSSPNYFLQIANLNFSLYDFNGEAEGNIDPVGDASSAFAGVYDGGGYVIENVQISSSADYVGLFGQTTSSAKIYNLGIKNSTIASTGTGAVGAVVGNNQGLVKYVFSDASVSGSGFVGGIVGQNSGSVISSYNSGALSGSQTGGVIGSNSGQVNGTYNSGSGAQGGIIYLHNAGSVSNSLYLNSSSSAIASGGSGVGLSTVLSASSQQLACQQTMTINGQSQYAVALINAAAESGEMPAYFYSRDGLYAYPQLWMNTQDDNLSLTGDGSASSPYVVASPQAMAAIGREQQITDLTQISLSLSADYIQPADIYFEGIDTNLTGPGTFTPIGLDEATGTITAFDGTYYGDSASGKTVSLTGLDIQSAHNNIALFATVGSGAVVDGLEISNSSISTSTTSPFNMAAFAVTNNGTISNCVNKMNIEFTMSSSHDNGTNVGGIVANNNGRILLCSNLATISVYNPNNSTGASSFVSGIAASSSGDIERSYNAGYIMGGQTGGLVVVGGSGATVSHCFNIGDVDCMFAPWSAGLVCNGDGFTMSYCYNLGHADYGIGVYGPSSQTHVYYLNSVASANYYNGNSTDNLISVNQLAGMVPLSGSSYFMDIFNAGGTFWEYDRLYTSVDALPYQFAHLIDNKCEKTYSYAMQISVDGYHLVDSVAKFNGIATSAYNNIYYGGDGRYRLTADINYNGGAYSIKGDFTGILDGNGRTVSNAAEINSGSYTQLGMFNRILGNAQVKNLNISNIGVTNTSGNSDVSAGILAGRIGLGVIIENVHIRTGYAGCLNNTGGFVGSITNVDSATGGYIRGCSAENIDVYWIRNGLEPNRPTGGFVGWCNGGQISSCYFAHDDTSPAEGSVAVYGNWMVGGFVGVTGGSSNISNCFAYGSVYSDRRTSSGLDDDRDSVGGFIGLNNSSSTTISNCYAYVVIGGYAYDEYDLASTRRMYVKTRGFGHNKAGGTFSNNYCYNGSNDLENAGATELSADQLRSQGSFSGWDFTNTWQMSDSGTIPFGMPIPRATQQTVAQTGNITIATDGNVTAQAYANGALVATATSSSSGSLQFTNMQPGDYTIVLHRNGQTLSDASNYTSAESRGLEVLSVSLSAGTANVSASSSRYFASGLGTQTNPYIIASFQQFLNIEKFSGQGDDTYYSLHSNIDANGQVLTSTITNFMGNFDGNGYQIQNFTISKTSGAAGLFEQLNNAVIENLGVSGFTITNYDQSGAFTGGLAASASSSQIISSYAENGILNVNANAGSLVGQLTSSTVTYSYATNNVTSLITEQENYTANLGGFVGQASGASVIDECYSDGNVTGTKRLGGFIAYADDVSISNSYTTVHTLTNYSGAEQSQVGGFAGYVGASSEIENCFMYGSVLNQIRELLIGSFIGENHSSAITNCYYWEINNFPGIYLNDSSATVESLSTVQFNSASSFNNYDFVDVWGMPSSDSQVAGSPILRNVANAFKINEEILGEGTQFNPYVIFDAATLSELMEYHNNYSGEGQVYFKLQKDIDLSESNWTPLGTSDNPFTGVLLGNGKTISGLTFSGTTTGAYGLFGYTDGAVIEDLTVSSVNISLSSAQDAGAVVGYANNTTFTNVSVEQATISSQGNAGVIVGQANGADVSDVYVSGNHISSSSNGGGIVGYAVQTNISASTATNTTVNATTNAGAFAGLAENSVVGASISTANTVSAANAGGIVGSASSSQILSVTVNNLSVQSASYAGGVAGQITQGSVISGANVYISSTLASTQAAGGIVGRGENSQIRLTNINSNWSVAGTISSANVGGIIGHAVNMTSIVDNRLAYLTLSPTSAGTVGQIYGLLEGSSGASSTLYREITVSNTVGAIFNNMTGTTITEPVYEGVTTGTVNWVLVN